MCFLSIIRLEALSCNVNWSVEVCLAVWLVAGFAASGLGVILWLWSVVESVAIGPAEQWCVFSFDYSLGSFEL